MSILPFSEPTNKTGMYEMFQDLTSTNSNSYSAYKFARDANNAYSNYAMRAIRKSGTAQFDDTNQTDYPELKIDLVSGQFDYPFTVDASSTPNQVIEIERVEIATDATGDNWIVLPTYDELNSEFSIVQDRNTLSGVPTKYSKKANGIFFDVTPNYNCRLANEGVAGIRVFFKRNPVYFLGTDTTKTAGIPEAHYEYLVYRPAYLFAVKNLPSLVNGYLAILQKLEKEIDEYYGSRDRDFRKIITIKKINYI